MIIKSENDLPKPAPFTFNSDTYYVCVDCRTGEVTYGPEWYRKRMEQLQPLFDAFQALLRTVPHPE